MSTSPSTYIDRRSGGRRQDTIYRKDLLDWMYNSRPGWWLTRLFLSRKIVSQFYGWLNRRPASVRKIAPFVTAMDVDMTESVRPVESFTSFNDFITREIDLSRRPVHPDPRVCVAPADGRVLAFQTIGESTRFMLKQSRFTLQTLLRDDTLASRYAGGSMLIARLYLADYHHFHFPADGIAHESHSIAGKYYATTPYSRRWEVPFLVENHRQVTVLESDHFGSIGIIEVGAFTFGSIQQRFAPGRVERAGRKGMFELGGSAIVLLFEPRRFRLDEDLCQNTANGIETYVRLGDSIGSVPAR
jgi:phosphatidylserine decarboxylase